MPRLPLRMRKEIELRGGEFHTRNTKLLEITI